VGDKLPNRIIKESVCTSENINRLSYAAEVLFYRLMVKADDFGCYHGNVKIIKGTCYPLKSDDIKDKQMIEWIDELVKAGLIFLYSAEDGKQYIKLAKWEKHQQTRAVKPKFPLPKSDDINCNQLNTNVPVFVFENVNVNDNRNSISENVNESDATLPDSAKRIIDYLNEKAGTQYRCTAVKTKDLIKARLNENFTEQDFYRVIDKKCDEWMNDEKMCKFLRPETLFSNKFEGYLNQRKAERRENTGNIFLREDI
jgi:uncharacterized phage protein (TIGR02220 family)